MNMHDAHFIIMNVQHPSIRFTMEKEVGIKLAFLDVLVYNDILNVHYSIFHKKLFRVYFLTTLASLLSSYKVGLIKT